MERRLTINELRILGNVAGAQIEENYSEYTSIDSNEEKGIIGSLVKKGLIVNGYSGDDYEGYMFYLTEEGFECCKAWGIPTNHIILFN